VDEYFQMALQTIEAGVRFTFRRTGIIRLGYYHRRTRRFVVVEQGTNRIQSLSTQSENHVRRLASSTYERERAD
jgi:hypothetical protein